MLLKKRKLQGDEVLLNFWDKKKKKKGHAMGLVFAIYLVFDFGCPW